MEYQDGWTLEQAKEKYSDLLQSHHSLCVKLEMAKTLTAELLEVIKAEYAICAPLSTRGRKLAALIAKCEGQ